MPKSSRNVGERATLLMKKGFIEGLSMAAQWRNKLLELGSVFLDLWAVTLGVVAFLHLVDLTALSIEMWFALTIAPVVLSVFISAWYHGVLRAEASNLGESLNRIVSENSTFKQSVIRMVAAFVVFAFSVFLFIYIRDSQPSNTTIVTNGGYTFINAIFLFFLGTQILSGVVHSFLALFRCCSVTD